MPTIKQDLQALKTNEDTLVANKVCNFSYTQRAYTENDVNGVPAYDYNNEQNTPIGTASVMQISQTSLDKGFRAQASSLTRMFMNHFFGRVSFNLNKLADYVSALLGHLIDKIGVANGLATLDENGRIPYEQLPEEALVFEGYWDADTNTPTLADGTGTKGDFWIVSVAGEQDLGSGTQDFLVGDRVLYDGYVWKNISGGNVKSVNGVLPDANGNVQIEAGGSGINYSTSEFDTKKTWIDGKKIYGKVFNNITKSNKEGLGLVQFNGSAVDKLNYASGYLTTNGSSSGIYLKSNNEVDFRNLSFTQQLPAYVVTSIVFNNKLLLGTYDKGIYTVEHFSEEYTQATATQNTSFPTAYGVQSFIVFNDVLYVGTKSQGVFTSTDGENFTLNASFPTNLTVGSMLIFNNKLFVLNVDIGYIGGLYSSSDGETFTRIDIPKSTTEPVTYYSEFYAMCVYDNKLYIETRESGTGYLLYSSDGTNFTYDQALLDGQDMICSDGYALYAIKENHTGASTSKVYVVSSSNNLHTGAMFAMRGTIYFNEYNNVSYAHGFYGIFEHSLKTKFQMVESSQINFLSLNAYSGTEFFGKYYIGGVSTGSSSENCLYVSDDGIYFSPVTTPFTSGVTSLLVYNDVMYVGTWSEGIYTSYDGYHFQQSASFPTTAGVAYLSEFKSKLIVLVRGTSAPNGYKLYTSNDGVTFTAYTASSGWSALGRTIEYKGTLYLYGIFNVASGGGNSMYYTNDGETFSLVTIESQVWTQDVSSMCVFNGALFARTISHRTYSTTDNIEWARQNGLPSNLEEGTYIFAFGDRFYSISTLLKTYFSTPSLTYAIPCDSIPSGSEYALISVFTIGKYLYISTTTYTTLVGSVGFYVDKP
jgi:hypothetical protein